jgi:hypothetical protein
MRSTTARRPRSRRARTRLAATLSATAALLLAVSVVWQSASAGFTDATATLKPGITAATLALTDDDAATRLFSVSGLKPGDTATRCIAVTSTSTVPVDVRLFVTGRSSTNQLGTWLKLTVKAGTGGSSSSCGTFVANPTTALYTGSLSSVPADTWDAGVQGWTTTNTTGTAATAKRTYQLTYTLDTSTPTSVQNGAASATFVWESRKR